MRQAGKRLFTIAGGGEGTGSNRLPNRTGVLGPEKKVVRSHEAIQDDSATNPQEDVNEGARSYVARSWFRKGVAHIERRHLIPH